MTCRRFDDGNILHVIYALSAAFEPRHHHLHVAGWRNHRGTRNAPTIAAARAGSTEPVRTRRLPPISSSARPADAGASCVPAPLCSSCRSSSTIVIGTNCRAAVVVVAALAFTSPTRRRHIVRGPRLTYPPTPRNSQDVGTRPRALRHYPRLFRRRPARPLPVARDDLHSAMITVFVPVVKSDISVIPVHPNH